MIYKDNAVQTLVALLDKIQKTTEKEKLLKTMVIEDRVSSIIENIIRETELRVLLKIKNGAVNVQPVKSKNRSNMEM
jgi:hypothetical protein